MQEVQKKTVVVGVCGGIAAYKVVDVVSELRKRGIQVFVVMTTEASRFVQPLTFEVISGNKVFVEMFESQRLGRVDHVELADRADVMLIAPATANVLGKVAAGIADDLLSTVIMTTKAQVIFAPSMNVNMWQNPIVQRNVHSLKSLGYEVIEPEEGELACGYEGKGRLPSVKQIVERVLKFAHRADQLQGLTFLVTAGPTREHIDPVRFVSNRSSGKMGYAIAEEAAVRGARVILVSGPTSLCPPAGCEVKRVTSASEMREAVISAFPEADVIIKAAAVSDFRPAVASPQKLTKGELEGCIKLEQTPDILRELGELKASSTKPKLLVGFAAETGNAVEKAISKLHQKNLDLIVVNDVTVEGAGFEVDTNQVQLIRKDGKITPLPLMSKKQLARLLIDEIQELWNEKS